MAETKRGIQFKYWPRSGDGLIYWKILDFDTRCKLCRICDNAKQSGRKPRPHDCRKNHSGSSKRMEPAVAVDLFQRAPLSKIKYHVYTSDDDTTTQSHIREKVSYDVEKQSDVVHTKRHENCDQSWCQFKKDPTTYRHSELPFGKDLQGDALEAALTAVFDDYSTDIVVKKLAPATNSQRNEAFNNVVGSKNPKIRFYGGSESNDFRVACGVSQTNEGREYICQTLREVNIEPGVHCIAYNKVTYMKYSKDKIRKSSISFKKRRSQLHRNKLNSKTRSEAREGTTYETNVGLNLDDDSIVELLKSTNNLPKSKFQEYETMVPAFIQRHTQPKISYNHSLKYQFVVFDTETTSLGKEAKYVNWQL
ncbi:hypothetical protein OS493_013379 [Desmophyllum pertusum]|uniref:Mutator-like transposase domain-containing protein n=1 Tax=Desmophyllum pertusum TaxID=174260 RepID=A0A9W9YDP8_9CNID|nr:hypothetical protein OS493_013379 [Desmophyllum pertusum]